MAESPAEAFARQLRESRIERGWQQEDLVDRMHELGTPMSQSTISRLEGSDDKPASRKASIDDAFRLAAAVGVAPIHLLVPRQKDGRLRLALGLELPAPTAAQWVAGYTPLVSDRHWPDDVVDDYRTYDAQVSERVLWKRATGAWNIELTAIELTEAAARGDTDVALANAEALIAETKKFVTTLRRQARGEGE